MEHRVNRIIRKMQAMRMVKILKFLIILAVIPSTISLVEIFINHTLPLYNYLRVHYNKIYENEFQHNLLLEKNRKLGKLQQQISEKTPFLCDVNGPGRRSSIPPSSVHKLRPGDIDVIAALGDSISSGNAILARNVSGIMVEDKGLVFNIGGDGSWRQFLTLPNILKEFNPNLYGYSYGNGHSNSENSKLNMAEPVTTSSDILRQAKNLYDRMKADPNVDMQNNWKLLTMLIGSNDFCSRMCFHNSTKFVTDHKEHVIKVLRFVRDNIPKTLVSYMPLINLKEYYGTNRRFSLTCSALNSLYCPCFLLLNKTYKKRYFGLMQQWVDVEYEAVNRPEFHTKEDFDVVIQPFMATAQLPKLKDGTIDPKYLAFDCFHFSQKGQASLANALWNSLLQPEGQKHLTWLEPFENFECPTEERPYIATTKNNQN